jgi:hypothetical protein
MFGIDHHPVRSIKGGFAASFLTVAAPLLKEAGKQE